MAIFTAISGYITSALIGAGLSAVVAGAVANIAIGVGLMALGQLATGLFSGRPQTSTPQAQATLNQSAGPRIRGYGRAKLGGTRAFWDSRNGKLYQVIMAHHGRVAEFEQFFVGDKAVSISGSEVTTAPFNGYIRIETKQGDAGQTAQSVMTANWGSKWTSEHRLRGIANWAVLFRSPDPENFQKVFPESYNTPVRCVCRLSAVWDPRDAAQDPEDESTWGWSDTAALCILDYLRHPDGYRLTVDDLDIPSFIAKANIDEQLVPLRSGGSVKRYRLWGVYSLTDHPADVLAKMRATCDAEFYETPEGKLAIRGGIWEAPTVTISQEDILGHTLEQGNNRFAAFNELKILYTSSSHDFQTVEATSWIDLEDQAARGPLPSELPLDMVPSASQARRLAKIHIAKANPAWKGTIVASLSALNALGERTVRLILPELGIDDAFYIAGFSIKPDLTGVDISVMSISQAAYEWDAETEEGDNPAIPQDTAPDLTFPVPDTPVLTLDGDIIVATFTAPVDRDDLELHAQIRAGAGSTWQEMSSDEGSYLAEFGPAADGDYQVRGRWLGAGGTAGDWSTPLAEITVP